jgi:cytochrome c2
MPSHDETFYDLKRLHLVFAVSSLALLAATLWMVVADHRREWKVYQRTYRDQIEPEVATAGQASKGDKRRSNRPLGIQQIWLPELTLDYHFQKVARFDRCTTCHLGIDQADKPGEQRRNLPQPYRSHPRLDLFVGSRSPHPVETFGCTICHAGQGSATSFKFASHTPNDPEKRTRWQKEHGWFWNHDWALPMHPSRFVESSCLKCHYDVVDLEPTRRYPDPPAPKLLAGYHLVRQYGCFGCHEIKGVSASGERTGPDMRLEPAAQAATKDSHPGTLRKVGPSLREAGAKFERQFVRDWLLKPSRFRPKTRMPQFFGQVEHLEGETLAHTLRLEAVEVEAITHYLLAVSSPASLQATLKGASVERGKRLFEFQGCLACHRHNEFPEGQATQGPDLSNLGAKLTTPAGAAWLASWLRDPVHHSPRTLMPNPMLAEPDLSDPAADLAAYLLASRDYEPVHVPALIETDLDALALEHLSKTYPKQQAEQYLAEGIPASMADQVQGDARELIGPITRDKKIRYVGRRTIRKRGCYGCHDIPGFETAPLIGPALSDWGRKQESLLAFEQVDQFLAKESADQPADADTAFFHEAVRSKRREGFLWQKLRAPRSFDYHTAERKGFNEQLLMGRFSFSAEEREAIMTFILGLVADPPAEKYVAQPKGHRQAIVEGRKVLDQYGCALCHTLEMERWTFQYDSEEMDNPAAPEDFAFMAPKITADQLAASAKTDHRGLGHAEVVGMPRVDAEGKLLLIEGDQEDENGDPLPMAAFTLWEPAAINGQLWPVGGADLLIYRHQVTRIQKPWGGDFARLLYPKVLADAKAQGTSAAEVEAWGWVPPALVHEGLQVRPDWLFDYLLQPSVIRPATVLRMPKYNLSTDEARKLVDYFAAAAGADFPYTADSRSPQTRPIQDLDQAMRLLTDRTTYCAKCHLIGDFTPGGENRTILAPNLDQVGRRIRPDYVRRWLANPKSVLPYTAMPVNFPPSGDPMGQDLYPGSSLEQLDAVTDLLLDYDDYLKRRTSIRTWIDKPSKP